jgi:serine/threonine protein kinase
MDGAIYLLINAVSAFVTSLQILQSLLIADYRQALAFHGDQAAAQRIILPCYRPLFIALIFMYFFLSLYQGLLLLDASRRHDANFVLDNIKIYCLCVLSIFSIIPVLLIQKSVSLKGFWRSFYLMFPLFMSCLAILLSQILLPIRLNGLICLTILLILLVSIPTISLSSGVLLGYIHCRVRLKSVSNRNVIELMCIYASLYTIGLIASGAVLSQHYDNDSAVFKCLIIYFVAISILLNHLFPFALYRGLLADTKFWRGLGTHNQGGLSLDADSGVRHLRPTAASIDLNIASSSFQRMMSEISDICLDFAYVQIDRWIGQGATSEVYCGRYNNVLVAVKVSTPPEITVEVLQVFAHEAKLCSMLKHKHIVTFHGICVRPPQVGMVFELCEGGNLRGHLQKHALRWTPIMRMKACLDCAEAVAYLHSRGFIHRDLKAENFFVTRKMVVKLGDFGEAAFKRNEESTESRKMTVLGTVTHMAPELITASRYYTEAVDVYALAMTFIEIWTGSDPYQELNHFQIYQQVMDGKRPKLPENAPAGFIEIINQAWEQDFKQRPSAEEIVEDLQNLLAEMTGQPVQKRETSSDSQKSDSKQTDTGESVEENTEFSPRARTDPRNSADYYVARLILKARQMLRIREDNDVEENEEPRATELANRRNPKASEMPTSSSANQKSSSLDDEKSQQAIAVNPIFDPSFSGFSYKADSIKISIENNIPSFSTASSTGEGGNEVNQSELSQSSRLESETSAIDASASDV